MNTFISRVKDRRIDMYCEAPTSYTKCSFRDRLQVSETLRWLDINTTGKLHITLSSICFEKSSDATIYKLVHG